MGSRWTTQIMRSLMYPVAGKKIGLRICMVSYRHSRNKRRRELQGREKGGRGGIGRRRYECVRKRAMEGGVGMSIHYAIHCTGRYGRLIYPFVSQHLGTTLTVSHSVPDI
jgi:hypothetical protein